VYNCEAGDSEVRERISKIPEVSYELWKNRVKIYERTSDFDRVIKPNLINIIDYIERNENPYLIGNDLRAIHEKLQKGIAIVNIQKESYSALGSGAGKGLNKPRLYLIINPGELIIQKAKNYRGSVNPNGMRAKFKLIDGNQFITQMLTKPVDGDSV